MGFNLQEAIAIIFSVFLVMSATTSGAAVLDSSTQNTPTVQNSQETSIDIRKNAITKLQQATLKGKNGRKKEFLRSLNETLGNYVGINRVNESVFTTDRRIATRTQQQAPEVAENLANSDEQLAKTAIDDARTTQ